MTGNNSELIRQRIRYLISNGGAYPFEQQRPFYKKYYPQFATAALSVLAVIHVLDYC